MLAHMIGPSNTVAAPGRHKDDYWELINLTRAHGPYHHGAKGNIGPDIHNTNLCAAHSYLGTIFPWCIHQCKDGYPQCWCTSSPVGDRCDGCLTN